LLITRSSIDWSRFRLSISAQILAYSRRLMYIVRKAQVRQILIRHNHNMHTPPWHGRRRPLTFFLKILNPPAPHPPGPPTWPPGPHKTLIQPETKNPDPGPQAGETLVRPQGPDPAPH
jgi:hypothetical protein